MFWYGRDPSGWGRLGVPVAMIALWAALIAFCVLLVRALDRPSDTEVTTGRPRPAPDRLLAERFARGEIDEDEYRRRLTVLLGADGPPLGKSRSGARQEAGDARSSIAHRPPGA
ncbi:SHOCT domain-containing protein [Streptomyces sp. NPDC002580]|uniref:SHOCT domain-containing protein n=1 Tax=Streptomyces sp. NPDC002580 TaxID=3364653 RepID=UPI0036AEA54A